MPPTLLILLILVILILVALAAVLKAKLSKGSSADESLYELRPSLFTPAERSFLGVLENALPEGVGLLAKVRLGDVFKTRKGLSPSDRTRANNRINQKHVDFLLVRTSDLLPLAGVELDDRSHEEQARRDRDTFVDAVFKSANIPLLHLPAQATYSLVEIKSKIADTLRP